MDISPAVRSEAFVDVGGARDFDKIPCLFNIDPIIKGDQAQILEWFKQNGIEPSTDVMKSCNVSATNSEIIRETKKENIVTKNLAAIETRSMSGRLEAKPVNQLVGIKTPLSRSFGVTLQILQHGKNVTLRNVRTTFVMPPVPKNIVDPHVKDLFTPRCF